jgi:membrane protease subunit HflK
MAWNEPGNKNENPWGNKRGGNEPPDFEELLRRLKQNFAQFFGDGSGSSHGWNSVLGALGFFLVVWFALGCYTVNEQEQAVVLRFGKYYETRSSGFAWNPYFVDTVQKVNVTNVKSLSHKALILTEDDNIIDVKLSVQYIIVNPKDFLLNVRDPEISLEQASESAIRHVVGGTKMDPVLGNGRVLVAAEVKDRIQRYMDNYQAGIQVSQVTIDDAQPPVAVKAAFDNVTKAKEDRERFKNEAQAYANGVVPEAEGLAARKKEESDGYKAAVIARAEGEAQRFENIVEQYKKAPEVMRQRLYLDAVQTALTNSSKILIDTKNGNPMFYVPLDKMITQTDTLKAAPASKSIEPTNSASTNTKNNERSREVR